LDSSLAAAEPRVHEAAEEEVVPRTSVGLEELTVLQMLRRLFGPETLGPQERESPTMVVLVVVVVGGRFAEEDQQPAAAAAAAGVEALLVAGCLSLVEGVERGLVAGLLLVAGAEHPH